MKKMKIDDLIQPRIERTNQTVRNFFLNSRYLRDKNITKSILGKPGAFSYVKDDPESPFMVDKKTKSGQSNKGFDKYAKFVLENQNHNPFLPRIYAVTIHSNEEGKDVCEYKMEKLTEWRQIDREILNQYLCGLFDVYEDFYHLDQEKSKGELNKQFTSMLRKIVIVAGILRRQEYNKIKNDLLRYTVKMIHHLFPQNVDFFNENLMFRVGKNGIQLVLSDPVYED